MKGSSYTKKHGLQWELFITIHECKLPNVICEKQFFEKVKEKENDRGIGETPISVGPKPTYTTYRKNGRGETHVRISMLWTGLSRLLRWRRLSVRPRCHPVDLAFPFRRLVVLYQLLLLINRCYRGAPSAGMYHGMIRIKKDPRFTYEPGILFLFI